MNHILPDYYVSEATWFYLSLLLSLAVFFRFDRIISLRNLDLLLLLSISPGLLFVGDHPLLGNVWLFVGTGLLVIRMSLDCFFQRRPRGEQNLNSFGMAFLCISIFAFLVVRVFTENPAPETIQTVKQADSLLSMQDVTSTQNQKIPEAGPTARLLIAPVVPLSSAVVNGANTPSNSGISLDGSTLAARIMAILAHAFVVVGLIIMGKVHFADVQLGLAMALLYLLLPCTAYDVSKTNHVLPAALLVWAFVAYQKPVMSGIFMGLACGAMFFPVFLLPLWASFYRKNGLKRFAISGSVVGIILLGSLILTSVDRYSFTQQTIGSIDWSVLKFEGGQNIPGFWGAVDSAYRIPVFVGFVLLIACLTIWPRRKNLGHLMSHTTAIIIATLLWYPQQGSVYLLWYLPMLLMVVFRPRLFHQSQKERDDRNQQETESPTSRFQDSVGIVRHSSH
ncbi:MAG: glycosyltransferase family 87 protein [Gimesia sp.]|nr:glycosyltransferase family 87 protein [Gimesia sp.]